jgi:putative redox protein
LALNLLPSKVFSPRFPLEITLQHTGGAQFIAKARKHRLVIDQPAEDGATDRGMSPAELLLVSLGSCIGQYAAQYLSLRGLSHDGLLVRVAADQRPRPLRLSELRVEVIAPALTERQLRALEKTLANAGLVHLVVSRENAVRIIAGSTLTPDVAE